MTILAPLVALCALDGGAAAPAIAIRSDSACPTAMAVQAALAELGGQPAPGPASVTVRSRGDRLTVELAWPPSAPSAERTLIVTADCKARAQSAAVVIASWLGLLPEVPAMPTPLAAPLSALPSATLAGARAPVPPPAHPSAAVPAAAVAPATTPLAANGTQPRQRPRHAWLGVGLTGATGGGVVPGLRIELLRARSLSGFELGWVASLLGTLPRRQALVRGTSSWIRPAIGLAAVASWGGPRLRLVLDLGALVGLTIAWGSNYANNRTDQSPTWGIAGGLRLQLALPSSKLWVELRAIDWLRAQRLQHDTQPTDIVRSADLPALEGLLTLGWSFGI